MRSPSRTFLALMAVAVLTGAIVFDATVRAGLATPEYAGPVVTQPSYGPGGREVAFWTTWRERAEIWAVSTVDGRLRPIAEGIEPAWSPAGSWIAFVSPRAGNYYIWIVRPDGSGLTQLTTGRARDDQPAWSPDGTQIAFVSNRAGPRNIWVVNADGSGMRRVTNSPCCQNRPSFSPEGGQIVFQAAAPSGSYLMITKADGTEPRQLTTGGFEDLNPRWGARGILFDSNRFDSWGIKMIQPDGSGLQAIPNATGAEPTWSPDGTKFAFSDEDGIYEFNFLNGTVRPLVQLKGHFVPIDIMPGVSPKTVSLRSTATIRVIILSAPGFNPVQQIDPTSFTFGRTGDEESLASCAAEGVNLVCGFRTALTGFRPGDTQGILRVLKIIGSERLPLEGRGAIQIVP